MVEFFPLDNFRFDNAFQIYLPTTFMKTFYYGSFSFANRTSFTFIIFCDFNMVWITGCSNINELSLRLCVLDIGERKSLRSYNVLNLASIINSSSTPNLNSVKSVEAFMGTSHFCFAL